MAMYLPSIFGALSFLSSVTALLTSSGVSFAVVSRPARLVTAVCAPFVPTLSQYCTFVPAAATLRTSLSCVVPADAPSSSAAPRITSSMACSSSWSDTDTYVPYCVMACVTALWPNFWPVGMTPSVSAPASSSVFHLRHSTVLPRPAGSACLRANCVWMSSGRAFSSSSVS